MLSLRSLAFILASAIRRARALSCAALHCFPDRISGKGKWLQIKRLQIWLQIGGLHVSLLRKVYKVEVLKY